MDQYITHIALTGKKESIVKMLNAVISNVGLEEAIADGDDLETINSKLKDDKGNGAEIGIPDLLSTEHLADDLLVQKRNDFGKDCEEDEPYNVCSGRAIEFVRVEDSGDDYIAKFSLYEYEDYNYGDYADWSDIARLYGCKVVIDVVLFMKGRFEEFCATTIFELVEGKVKETRVAPKLDVDEYIFTFNKLCKMAPKHYRQLKIQDMEAKVRALQTEISREKLLILLENLDETQGHLDVPEGVTRLSEVLWPYKDKLRSIYIPASVDTINKSAISDSSLETIEISPDNPNFCSVNNCILDKDKTRLLIGCKGSTVPEGITVIENSAFSGCRGLEEIVIPSHVKEIGRNAFSRCIGLSKLTIESGVEKLGWASFLGCSALTSVVLPDSLSELPSQVFEGCSSLESIEISPDNPNFCSENNCILDKGRTRLLIGCKGSVVPEGITVIEDSAFFGCSGLEEIVIPSHVKKIGPHAFYDCIGLSKLTIESGVEELDCESFKGCTALTSVVLPDSLSELPSQVFAYCTSLTDVTLPKHLENMEEDAFKNTPWGGGVDTTEKGDDDLPF